MNIYINSSRTVLVITTSESDVIVAPDELPVVSIITEDFVTWHPDPENFNGIIITQIYDDQDNPIVGHYRVYLYPEGGWGTAGKEYQLFVEYSVSAVEYKKYIDLISVIALPEEESTVLGKLDAMIVGEGGEIPFAFSQAAMENVSVWNDFPQQIQTYQTFGDTLAYMYWMLEALVDYVGLHPENAYPVYAPVPEITSSSAVDPAAIWEYEERTLTSASASDWSERERAQIRSALGVDGARVEATGGQLQQLGNLKIRDGKIGFRGSFGPIPSDLFGTDFPE